jgi:DNA adenine methylase
MKDKSFAADGFLRSPVKIIGGKTQGGKHSGRSIIYEMLPPAAGYIEPFLGSGAVLIGNPNEYVFRHVSDIQAHPINFFRCMQLMPQKLWEHLEAMIEYIQKEKMDANQPTYKYFHFLRDIQAEPTGIEGAVYFYLVNKLCMNGVFRFNSKGKCNSSFCGTYRGRGYLTREWYDKVCHQLTGVRFSNWSYEHTLDSALPNDIVVLDPPYHEVFTSYDRRRFSALDHYNLSERLKEAKYRWLLTINDHPAIRRLYAGFNFKEVSLHYSCSQSAAGRGKSPELFITNYEVPGARDAG